MVPSAAALSRRDGRCFAGLIGLFGFAMIETWQIAFLRRVTS
jgi:hypothetical protein